MTRSVANNGGGLVGGGPVSPVSYPGEQSRFCFETVEVTLPLSILNLNASNGKQSTARCQKMSVFNEPVPVSQHVDDKMMRCVLIEP